MPASSATIGCNIAALRVKVTGLAPCLLVRLQKHPFTVRFCATVSTDRRASARSVSPEKLILDNHRTADLWTLPPRLMAHGRQRCRPLPFRIGVKLTKYRC